MRTDCLGDAPDEAFIDRYVTPAEDGQAFFFDNLFKFFHLLLAECFVAMGKNHADTIFSFWRQGKAQDFTFPAEELMRYLYEDSCTVTALGIGAFSAAVLQIFQDG